MDPRPRRLSLRGARRDLHADLRRAERAGRVVVIDFEGTGNQVPRGTEILPSSPGLLIEIGAVELLLDGDRWRRGGTFHTYLNPKARLNPFAVRIHGIKSSFLADKPEFAEVWPTFRDFMGEAAIAAHAFHNERHALNYETRRIGVVTVDAEPYRLDRWLCTQAAFRQSFPEGKSRLDHVCDRLGIDRTSRRLHGALLDADLAASAFMSMYDSASRTCDAKAPTLLF